MIWIITPFSTNRLLKRDVGHWQKRSCVMGVLCQLLLTITPDLSVTEGVTKKEVSTLAMLDNCSQGTLMKESIKKKLGISGRKTEITIKTVNGKQKYRVSCGDWVKGFQKCSW